LKNSTEHNSIDPRKITEIMKKFSFYIFLLFMLGAWISCDDPSTDLDTDSEMPAGTGILDIAFVYRPQGIPTTRLKKAKLCLAHTSDELYRGIFFIQENVSDAVKHYQFFLPPGEYYYYATVVCLSSGDSCQFAGFSGQYGHVASGGKVMVEAGKTSAYTTNFH